MKVQFQFCSLDLYTISELHSAHHTCIIDNYALNMPPLYPRTSISENKSGNLNLRAVVWKHDIRAVKPRPSKVIEKPCLHIVVTITEHVCDDTQNENLSLVSI